MATPLSRALLIRFNVFLFVLNTLWTVHNLLAGSVTQHRPPIPPSHLASWQTSATPLRSITQGGVPSTSRRDQPISKRIFFIEQNHQPPDQRGVTTKRYMRSWIEHNAEYEIIHLTLATAENYVDHKPISDLQWSRIDVHNKLWILRVLLLLQHSGIVVAPTVFCATPLRSWIDLSVPFLVHRHDDMLFDDWFWMGSNNSLVLQVLWQVTVEYLSNSQHHAMNLMQWRGQQLLKHISNDREIMKAFERIPTSVDDLNNCDEKSLLSWKMYTKCFKERWVLPSETAHELLHIPRASGTALESALAQYGVMVGKNKVNKDFTNHGKCNPWHRVPRTYIPGSFAVVRNPFDRLLSTFCHTGSWHSDFTNITLDCRSFVSWSKTVVPKLDRNMFIYDCHLVPQWHYTERATYLHRFENMTAEWPLIAARYGINVGDTALPVLITHTRCYTETSLMGGN